MADQFGAAHRKLVQDTNEGKLAPASSPLTRSVDTSSTKLRTYESTIDDKDELYRGLLKLGSDFLGRVKEEKDRRDYIEGWNRGLEEGYLENERVPWRDMIFGPSATMRGAQERIIHNDSTQWYNAKLKSMDDDVKYMDEDEYAAQIDEEFTKTNSQYDDPYIQSQMLKKTTTQRENLGRVFAQKRKVWVDAANSKAMSDGIKSQMDLYRTSASTGDFESLKYSVEGLKEALVGGMDLAPDAHREILTASVIDDMSNNTDGKLLDLLKQEGYYDMLDGEQKERVDMAERIMHEKVDKQYYLDRRNLEDAIQAETATDEDLQRFAAQYPWERERLNKWREVRQDRVDEMNLIRQDEALARWQLTTGDIAFADRPMKERRKALEQETRSMAINALRVQRKEDIATGSFEGDPDADFTDEDIHNFMLENPKRFAIMYKDHPEIKVQHIQNLISGVNHTIHSQDATLEDVEEMTRKMEALRVYENVMGDQFSNQFRDAESQQTYRVYDDLVRRSGWNPIDAKRELQKLKDAPAFDRATIEEYEMEDMAEEVVDDFLDQSDESQSWFFGLNMSPDNEELFRQTVGLRLERNLEIYKGNREMAMYATHADMRRNGVVSHGQFIPDGKTVNIQGGTIEELMTGINGNAEMRSQIMDLGHGWAPDTDFEEVEISVNPLNKNTIILHGRHEKTGAPITTQIAVPQRATDFPRTDWQTWSGYNKYQPDPEKRRQQFIEENPATRAVKGAAKLMDSILK